MTNLSATTTIDVNDLDLPGLLRSYCDRAEAAMDHYLPAPETIPVRLHEAMRYATLNGGKRIRACLVYAAGAAVATGDPELDAPACAVELIHAYSLVHDDMPSMDDDDLRRGKPTCHKAYDEATALLVGDALQALAFEILSNTTGLSPAASSQRLQMLQTLSQAAGSRSMAGGQAIDLAAVGKPLALNELEAMHQMKTGALIGAAVRLGALANPEVGAETLAALDDYARCIGLAFQVVDDILDVEGDTTTLGKPQGSDAAQNKPTYPSLMGLDAAKQRAIDLRDQAQQRIKMLGDRGQALAGIADYIVQRTQ